MTNVLGTLTPQSKGDVMPASSPSFQSIQGSGPSMLIEAPNTETSGPLMMTAQSKFDTQSNPLIAQIIRGLHD